MPSGPRALEVLVDGLLERGEKIPGVVGALPEADHFAERYAAAAGVRAASRMDQGVHVLEAVESVPQPSGRVRAARPGDLDRILTWTRAFARESLPAEAWDEDEARRRLASRLRGEGGAYRFWEDGAPVCFAGTVAGTGGGGVRIGPVYTPPARRRRGYATALVAAASREALQGGAPFCLLTTDLANPTSNAIYRRIGYRRVHDAAMIAFAPPSSGAS
jgi:predicted GNAT family acetyltransferase